MTGGRTVQVLDPHQTILTEYSDQYRWHVSPPAKGVRAGHRGERTGMGMDHVGRLLAGRPTQDPPARPIDASLLSTLARRADQALSAGSMGHLTEMCRLKSPSPVARRLLAGLVAALGLPLRRWRDVRTRLLGNKYELMGYLRGFDKDAPHVRSSTLRPFVEDPNLAPGEVKEVAGCLVWVSRWLQALYNYASTREGEQVDGGTASAAHSPRPLPPPATPGKNIPSPRAALSAQGRKSHRRAHGCFARHSSPRARPHNKEPSPHLPSQVEVRVGSGAGPWPRDHESLVAGGPPSNPYRRLFTAEDALKVAKPSVGNVHKSPALDTESVSLSRGKERRHHKESGEDDPTRSGESFGSEKETEMGERRGTRGLRDTSVDRDG
ncbi:unnamed protein product, partial [Discosporangium mesarthrocarpum]